MITEYKCTQEVNRFYKPSINNLQRLLILEHVNTNKLLVHFPVAGQDTRNDIKSMELPLIMHSDEVYIFENPAAADAPASSNALHD